MRQIARWLSADGALVVRNHPNATLASIWRGFGKAWMSVTIR